MDKFKSQSNETTEKKRARNNMAMTAITNYIRNNTRYLTDHDFISFDYRDEDNVLVVKNRRESPNDIPDSVEIGSINDWVKKLEAAGVSSYNDIWVGNTLPVVESVQYNMQLMNDAGNAAKSMVIDNPHTDLTTWEIARDATNAVIAEYQKTGGPLTADELEQMQIAQETAFLCMNETCGSDEPIGSEKWKRIWDKIWNITWFDLQYPTEYETECGEWKEYGDDGRMTTDKPPLSIFKNRGIGCRARLINNPHGRDYGWGPLAETPAKSIEMAIRVRSGEFSYIEAETYSYIYHDNIEKR